MGVIPVSELKILVDGHPSLNPISYSEIAKIVWDIKKGNDAKNKNIRFIKIIENYQAWYKLSW